MKHIGLLIALMITLPGCGSMHGYEKAWHTMNVIDLGQTVHLTRNPECYDEVGFPTSQLYGAHPSTTEAYVSAAAYGLLYHYANRWLDKMVDSKPSGTQSQGNWVITRAVFNGVLIVGKGATILNNFDNELYPWGRGCIR